NSESRSPGRLYTSKPTPSIDTPGASRASTLAGTWPPALTIDTRPSTRRNLGVGSTTGWANSEVYPRMFPRRVVADAPTRRATVVFAGIASTGATCSVLPSWPQDNATDRSAPELWTFSDTSPLVLDV